MLTSTYNCLTNTTIKIETISIILRSFPCSFASSSISCPCSWEALFSVAIVLPLIKLFKCNHQYLSFVSGFFCSQYVLDSFLCGSTFLLLSGPSSCGITTVYLSIHPLMNIWVVFHFGLLWIKLMGFFSCTSNFIFLILWNINIFWFLFVFI